jgi:hypothetical protein
VTQEPYDSDQVDGAGGRRRVSAWFLMPEPSNADRGGGAVPPERARARVWHLLIVVPMIGTLIPPIYNTKDPTLIGIPFFYWYLMAWVLVTVVLMLIVNHFTGDDG